VRVPQPDLPNLNNIELMPDLVFELYPGTTPPSQLLSKATVALTADGSNVSLKATPPSGNRRSFQVPSSAKTLKLIIDMTLTGAGSTGVGFNILEQNFELSGMNLNPISSNAKGPKNTTRRLHPRITFSAEPGGLPKISTDLAFFDVTEIATQRGLLAEYYHQWSPDKSKSGDTGEPTGLAQYGNADRSHYGCALHILQFTGGEPAAWAVVVPPTVASTRSAFNALLFFGPAIPPVPLYDGLQL
jgi:hypothetical protein